MMCINIIYFFIVQSRKNVVAFVAQVRVDVLKFSSYITFADYIFVL